MSQESLIIFSVIGLFQLSLISFKFFGYIERSWFWVLSPLWGFLLLIAIATWIFTKAAGN
jgi:cell shape-determining protein MreC